MWPCQTTLREPAASICHHDYTHVNLESYQAIQWTSM